MLSKLKLFYATNKKRFDYIVSKLDFAILILYGLFVFEAFLRTTTFTIDWHPYYHFSLKIILILLVLGKSLLKFMDNIPLYMVLGFCAVGFLLAYLQGNHGILLELILFTVALKDIDYKKLISIFTTVVGVSLFIIILGSQTGVLNNLIYISGQRTKRISFGIHYPTNFASYVLYLCFAWAFLRKDKISYIEICLMYSFSYCIYYFCDARTSTICLLALSSILLMYKFSCKYIERKNSTRNAVPKWLSLVIACTIPVCAFISVGFSYLYSPNNTLLTKLDSILSNRFSLGNETFNNFNIKLFGQHIEMNGNGGFSIPWYNYEAFGKSGYNFIDSSYLSILFRYGLFVFVCVIVLFTLTSFVARKHKDYVTVFIIAIIAVHCIIEHHMLDFNYNPFMFLLISSYYKTYVNCNHTTPDKTVMECKKQETPDTTSALESEVQQ